MMDPKVQEILVKVARYIETAQPVIDKNNEERSNFTKRATQAAGVLASRGVIDRRRVNAFIDKVAEDPSAIWDFVEKLASAVSADTMGSAVQTKSASAGADPFERAFFGIGSESTGMVD